MPGYEALNDLFHLLDPVAYAHALTAWLQANSGLLPRSLALDGKSIGDGKCLRGCSHSKSDLPQPNGNGTAIRKRGFFHLMTDLETMPYFVENQ